MSSRDARQVFADSLFVKKRVDPRGVFILTNYGENMKENKFQFPVGRSGRQNRVNHIPLAITNGRNETLSEDEFVMDGIYIVGEQQTNLRYKATHNFCFFFSSFCLSYFLQIISVFFFCTISRKFFGPFQKRRRRRDKYSVR